MFWKKRRAKINIGGPPLRVVGDAAIATQILGEGKLIPLVIVGTVERPDFAELLRIHKTAPPGDVRSQWASPDKPKGHVALILNFSRPAQLDVAILFNIMERNGLIDHIVRAQAVYLQSGREGDRLMNTMDEPRILVGIGASGFVKVWDRMFEKSISKGFRSKGMSRLRAKEAAREFIQEWRRMTDTRPFGSGTT